jgi:hypothetical protein
MPTGMRSRGPGWGPRRFATTGTGSSPSKSSKRARSTA